MISKSESLPITIETNILLIIPLIYSPIYSSLIYVIPI